MGDGVVSSPLHICYVGDYSHASGAKFLGSLVTFCDAVNSSGEIIIYVEYVVSCVGLSLLSATGYWGCFCSMLLLVVLMAII